MASETPRPPRAIRTMDKSPWVGQECPHCHQPLQPGQQVIICPKDRTNQHATCWVEHGNTCATCAFTAAPVGVEGAAPAPARPAPAAAAPAVEQPAVEQPAVEQPAAVAPRAPAPPTPPTPPTPTAAPVAAAASERAPAPAAAGRGPRPMTTIARSPWVGQECPHCHQAMQPGERIVFCPSDRTVQHAACWEEHQDACASCGFSAPLTTGPAAATGGPPAAPRPPRPERAAAPQVAPGAAARAVAAEPTAAAATQPAAVGAGEAMAAARVPAAGAAGAAAPAQRVAAARPGARPAPRRPTLVTVWPHLLMPEFLSAMMLLVGLFMMAWFVNAPLEEHSDPNHTPNPSKAPWYFLNLQELLLHMHPSLAGVIVPGVLLLLLAVIPYVDIDTSDVGHWFASANGRKAAIISGVYSFLVTSGLILFDRFAFESTGRGTRGMMRALGFPSATESGLLGYFWPPAATGLWAEVVIPIIVMTVAAFFVYVLIRSLNPTVREIIIAYFTGFVVSWVVLTVVGTAFRGPGMEIYFPWAMPPRQA